MNAETKDGKNVLFTFEHTFTKIASTGEWMISPEFETPKIPGVKFSISVDIFHYNLLDIRVIKNDIRKAVSIIKIDCGGLNSTTREIDWHDISDCECIYIPFDFDVCNKDTNNPNFCISKSYHEYTVPIICTIIWGGFVEDLYYLNLGIQMKIFYDMAIGNEDDKFLAHKSLISAQSPVFHKTLTSMKESKNNSIIFPDTETDVLKELLLFIYKGKMDKAETDAELTLKLFKFAHMYQIDRLKTTCEYILITNLTIGNVFKIHDEGQLYKSVILQQHAITFIEMAGSAYYYFDPAEKDCTNGGVRQLAPKQKNVFEFQHYFSNHIENTELTMSSEFETFKIPGVKLKIITQINNDTKTVDVTITKDDPRKSISIITVNIQKYPITNRFVDWTKKVLFKNIPLSISSDDACLEKSCFLCPPNKEEDKYKLTVFCGIIWGGFVEDLYYPDVSTVLKNLHNNEEFSDMVIKIEDEEFPAHRSIISAQSPVFYKMLTSDMKESKENSITFPDTDSDVIKELLLFIYKGKMDKAETDAELALKLFKFAHMYQIDRLKTTCEYILITKLTKEHVFKIHNKGQLYNSVILQQHAITFIEMNADEMRNDAALELLPNSDCTGSTSESP